MPESTLTQMALLLFVLSGHLTDTCNLWMDIWYTRIDFDQ